MDQIASFIVFMLAAMAIGLAVLVAAVFCIGLCEGASWMFSRIRASAAVVLSDRIARIPILRTRMWMKRPCCLAEDSARR